MFSRGTFTLARIEEVLAALELDLYEVARMSRGANGAPAQLTHEQELALAKDERLLAVFWLVVNGWSFDEIVASTAVTRTELTVAYARLEKLVAEFNECAEADSTLPPARRVGIALLAGCGPWEFSAVNALKRRKSA
jgi:hypothetical protein